jgi:GT2 family glycosyltransferase
MHLVNKPRAAVVILNWNGRAYLEQFLPMVQQYNAADCILVVADNASTDDSVSFVRTHYPSVQIVQLAENFGFARGYNEALKQVQAAYYILLNSDVEVTEHWLEPVLDLMDADPTIGACQPKLRMYSEKSSFEYAGAAGGWIDFLGYPFARGRVFDGCETDLGQYDANAPIFWASGAAMFVRAELFHQLGGFDPYFFAHQEEIDFCWRLQLAGYRVMACPASTVYHVGGGTLPKGNARKVYLNFRNNLIMLAKNLPFLQAVGVIGTRFLLDAISAWKSLFEGQGTYFMAVVKAHGGFLHWLFLGRKESLFPKNKSGKVFGKFPKSIVWRHFILGKKRFSEIVGDNG